MRILSIGNRSLPWSEGGYEVVWSAATAALREAGHQVRILTTTPDPSDRVRTGPPPEDVYRGLRWYWRNHEFPPLGLLEAIEIERGNARVLRHHLSQFAPEVVCWWAMGGMSLSLISQVRRIGMPSVGVVGDEWPIYGPRVDGWLRRWRGRPRIVRYLAETLVGVPAQLDLDRSGTWLFNSRYLLDAARAAGWELLDAAALAPGVDTHLFSFSEPGPWRWRLLYSGRLDPRKGIDTAIEALGRLPAAATLTIAGDGDDAVRAQLVSLAERIGVAERVDFIHSQHESMPAVYRDADAVLFPVRWREPWGLVPLEAMAIGRPVVASRGGGGAAEYLEDGRNCLQFDPGDAAGLANALTRLAGDQQLRDRQVGAGRETAVRFCARGFHENLEAELERACAGGHLTTYTLAQPK